MVPAHPVPASFRWHRAVQRFVKGCEGKQEAFVQRFSQVICSMTAALAITPSPDPTVYHSMLQQSLQRETITPNVFGQL